MYTNTQTVLVFGHRVSYGRAVDWVMSRPDLIDTSDRVCLHIYYLRRARINRTKHC